MTSFIGQWIGRYGGTNTGEAILNIDERQLFYDGVAYLIPESGALPSTVANFRFDKTTSGRFETSQVSLAPVDPATLSATTWEAIQSRFSEDMLFSQSAIVKGQIDDGTLNLEWSTDIQNVGTARLRASNASSPSELAALEIENWDDFKSVVSTYSDRRVIFRGQSKPHRLRTSFHRHKRSNLARYLHEDLPFAFKQLCASLNHVFDLRDPDQNGAFLNLLQHHGYPTPLLDWTYSPYVAAYFAFANHRRKSLRHSSENVRVFLFDQDLWKQKYIQIPLVVSPLLHVSVCDFASIKNDRTVPQQGVSMVTNIDDIESYIGSREAIDGQQYLYAFDLPVTCAKDALLDLEFMGITPGSLFPGLDGACENLKNQHFRY